MRGEIGQVAAIRGDRRGGQSAFDGKVGEVRLRG
jgi:hypothetical protein